MKKKYNAFDVFYAVWEDERVVNGVWKHRKHGRGLVAGRKGDEERIGKEGIGRKIGR